MINGQMLSDLWDLVKPELPTSLVPGAHRPTVRAFCEKLPIQGHLGLELHLQDPDRSPDLSQVYNAKSANGLLALSNEADTDAAGKATLQALRRIYARPETARAVRLTWLEWDASTFRHEAPKPSIFLERSGQNADAAWQQARGSLASDPERPPGHGLGPGPGPRSGPGYEHDPGAEPGLIKTPLKQLHAQGIDVGIVGAMLARTPAPERLYLQGPDLRSTFSALRRLDGPTLEEPLLARLELLEARGIRLRPSIDLMAGEIGDRLGIDVAWPDAHDLRLPQCLVQWLAEDGSIPVPMTQALAEFPKVWTPLDRTWPDAYLLASLHQPENQFSRVTGYLHHIKLVCVGARIRAVKAYLGFAHQFVTPDASETQRGASDNPG